MRRNGLRSLWGRKGCRSLGGGGCGKGKTKKQTNRSEVRINFQGVRGVNLPTRQDLCHTEPFHLPTA